MVVKWQINGKFKYGEDPTIWDGMIYVENEEHKGILLMKINRVTGIYAKAIGSIKKKVEGEFYNSSGRGVLFQGPDVSKLQVYTKNGNMVEGNPVNVYLSKLIIKTLAGVVQVPTSDVVKMVPVF
jgi:hypothetical protein